MEIKTDALFNREFKECIAYLSISILFIYFYHEQKDILWLVDLWDMRQNPEKLKARARKIERSK